MTCGRRPNCLRFPGARGAGEAGRCVGGHVQLAGRGKHAVGICDDGVGICDDRAGARGGCDAGAGKVGRGMEGEWSSSTGTWAVELMVLRTS